MKRLSAAIVSWHDRLVGNEDDGHEACYHFKLGGAPEVEV